MSAYHGRARGRFPRRRRTCPPHAGQAKAARKAERIAQRQLEIPLFETVLGGTVRAAFGGFTCCYCGITLDKGYVEAFDNRMRCEHPRCAEVDAKARARGL